MSASPTNTETEEPQVNRQYVQRCLFNWRRQLGINLSVEEHGVFRRHKKYYLIMEELDPHIMCKMIKHFHPEFQFPSNPIPIPAPSLHIVSGDTDKNVKGHNGGTEPELSSHTTL